MKMIKITIFVKYIIQWQGDELMNRIAGKIVIPLISLMLIIGCSSGGNNPTAPPNQIDGANQNFPFAELDGNSANHSLCGIWEASFDIESLSATIQPNRTLNAHHNVTGMIPDPRITVNSWDPVEEVVDVDIQLHNPTWATAYDVRLIIFTDDDGHKLLNADNWTPLWDIPGGLIANPFKAYAKHEINRAFTGLMWHQENFQIRCPSSNFNVQFAVDASYPGNCEEPYEIINFNHEEITQETGSSGFVNVVVRDWQDDTSLVQLYCPAITGVNLISFNIIHPEMWRAILSNNTGAPEGEYDAFILAESLNSGLLKLYDKVRITIVSEHTPGVPANPELASIIHQIYHPGDIFFRGDYAYVVGFGVRSGSDFKVLDISDPYNPEIVAVAFDCYTWDVEFNGDYAYVSSENDGFAVLDISDPRNPFIVNSIDIKTNHIAISGEYAFFSSDHGTVGVMDISSPSAPVLVNTFDVYNDDEYIHGFDISGNYLCLTGYLYGPSRFTVVDISDPLNPEIKSVTEEKNAEDIVMSGSLAFVGLFSDGIAIFDISDPADPQIISRLDTYRAFELALAGNTLYIADTMSLIAVDVSDPANPVIISTYDTDSDSACYIGVSDNIACIVNGYYSLEFINITDPTDPQQMSIMRSNWMSEIDVKGDLAFVGGNHLKIIDISNPYQPEIITVEDHLMSLDITVSDGYAYSTSGSKIDVIDISDPLQLEIVGSADLFIPGKSLAFDGFYAYVATAGYIGTIGAPPSGSVEIADVSNPFSPAIIGSVETKFTMDIAVSGRYAYVADYWDGLRVIDVINPEEPVKVDRVDMHKAVSVDVSGNYAYVVDCDRQYFQVIDISDPYNCEIIFTSPVDEQDPYDIKVSRDFLYCTSGDGLKIYDISDPQNPVFFSEFSSGTQVNARYVEIVDNFAYMTCSSYGFIIVRLW
jgi:hypothetical protein